MIKKIFLLALISLISIGVYGQSIEDFYGTWEGEDQGEVGAIIFQESGFAYMKVGDQTHGGEEFVLDGQKASLTYIIDTESKPIHIDLVMRIVKTGEERSLLFIAEFVNSDQLKLSISPTGQYPESFDDGDTIILTRVKEN